MLKRRWGEIEKVLDSYDKDFKTLMWKFNNEDFTQQTGKGNEDLAWATNRLSQMKNSNFRKDVRSKTKELQEFIKCIKYN